MGNRLFLLYLIVLTNALHAAAQPTGKKNLDSLRAIAFKTSADTHSIKAYTELQRFYFNGGRYDSALYYSRRSLPVTRQVGNKPMLARIYYNAGLIYTNLTRYDSAVFYLTEAERMARQVADTHLLVSTFNANALLSNYQSDFKTAVEYLTGAATLIESSKTGTYQHYLPQLYGNIGHNLIAEKQWQKGIVYEKKALAFSGYPDEKRYRVMLHLDIADAYIESKQPTVAKPHLDSAALLSEELHNLILETMLLSTWGNYYAELNNLFRSSQSFLRAYQIADSLNNDYIQSEAADNVAITYLKQGNWPAAEKFALIANSLAAALKNHQVRTSSYETLKKVALQKEDFEKAFIYSELQKLYADSSTNAASQKSSLYLEARYQSVKKENDIAALTLSNANTQLVVLKRNRWLLIGSVSAALLLLFMALLFRQSRQKRLIAEKDALLQQEQVKYLERQQQFVSLQSMVNGQETERSRIAKDLHDGLGGLFSTIKMYFSTLQHEQPPLKQDPLFVKSYEMVNTASEEVRRIAHNMMPEVLIKLGLLQAVQELCNSISAGKLLRVTLQTYGMEKRLNAFTEVMLFRIIQELLNNIIKHAKASEAIIQFNREAERLSIMIEDNGHGFNLASAEKISTAGLESVKSRVNYLNGTLSIDSQKGSGTTVMMDFLLNEN